MSALEVETGSTEPDARCLPEIWYGTGKCRHPVGAGRPTGEELSSVMPQGGRGKQGPAPKDSARVGMESDRKHGLLVVSATVKGFGKPWSILIDSGASGNYVRRRSLEGSQQYADALAAQKGDKVTVRLVTGTCVTVPKVPVNLEV